MLEEPQQSDQPHPEDARMAVATPLLPVPYTAYKIREGLEKRICFSPFSSPVVNQ